MPISDATLLTLARMSVGTPVTDGTDFTALTPAQVAAKYALSSYGGDVGSSLYAPGADGDYDALDPDDPPVTDLGLWSVGGFVNLAPGSALGGTTKPNAIYVSDWSASACDPLLGCGALEVAKTANSTNNAYGLSSTYAVADTPPVVSASCLFRSVSMAHSWSIAHSAVWGGAHLGTDLAGSDDHTPLAVIDRGERIVGDVVIGWVIAQPTGHTGGPPKSNACFFSSYNTSIVGSVDCFQYAAPQVVIAPAPPPILALSSAATTTKLAAITQREVAVWKPFVQVIKATTGEDPGAHQVFYSLSRSADDLIEIYRATSTDQVTLKIRNGGVDYTKALGSVADNTAFSVAINVFASFTAASLDGGTVQVLTAPKPSGVLTLESIGCKHDGTLQWGGPIAECNLIHPAVYTAAQLEAA